MSKVTELRARAGTETKASFYPPHSFLSHGSRAGSVLKSFLEGAGQAQGRGWEAGLRSLALLPAPHVVLLRLFPGSAASPSSSEHQDF